MSIQTLTTIAADKNNFETIASYVEFCHRYLDFVAEQHNLQATIISRNENHYVFYQYKQDGDFQITRPINTQLMYDAERFETIKPLMLSMLHNARELSADERVSLNNAIYTIQQTVGAALDALPAGKSNQARKINGDLFERFIRLIIEGLGVPCRAGVMKIPFVMEGEEQFTMNYQHDLIVESNEEIRVLGSIKTSSKDRIDKIFIDKFLYSKLTDTTTPHIAVFLNDVQRKNTRIENNYGINATFLPGHFIGYTVKLNALDGVYYCDIRPNMKSDNFLKRHIRTLDFLLCEDIWRFIG